MLLAKTRNGNTAFQLAAGRNNVEILNRMWVWAKEKQICPNELKNKLLLSIDKFGRTAWHDAADQGRLKASELLMSWGEELELNTDDLW